MNFEKFKEYILQTPVLSEEYKKGLLFDAKDYEAELLKKIIIVVYNSELKLIETWDKIKLENDEKLKKMIKEDEEKDRKEAEEEIDKLLNI